MTDTIHVPAVIRDALTAGRALTTFSPSTAYILGHVTVTTATPEPGTPLRAAADNHFYPGRYVYAVMLTDEHLTALADGITLTVVTHDVREDWRTAGVVTVTPDTEVTLHTRFGDHTFTPVPSDQLVADDVVANGATRASDRTALVTVAVGDFNPDGDTIACATRRGRIRSVWMPSRIAFRAIDPAPLRAAIIPADANA